MLIDFRNLAITLALCLPFGALALDNTSSVKVTPLLKTTQSWDGKPIVYPEGQAEITGLLVEIAPGGEPGKALTVNHPEMLNPALGKVSE